MEHITGEAVPGPGEEGAAPWLSLRGGLQSSSTHIADSAQRGGFCTAWEPPRKRPCPSVTNGSELWSGDATLDKPEKPLASAGLASWADSLSGLREELGRQTPTLSVHESKASLQLQWGGQTLTFDLHKMPMVEARKEHQDLLFGLVEKVQDLEKELQEATAAASSVIRSPEKNPLQSGFLFAPDLSPIKSRSGVGAGRAAAKRRIPGESLINPGFVSKKTPTGVDFEDL